MALVLKSYYSWYSYFSAFWFAPLKDGEKRIAENPIIFSIT